MNDDNSPKQAAGVTENHVAREKLRVRVCSSCAMDKSELAAVVRELQTLYAERIHFLFA